MFRKSTHKVKLVIVSLMMVVVVTMAMIAAPQSVAVACEGAGGVCSCPGC